MSTSNDVKTIISKNVILVRLLKITSVGSVVSNVCFREAKGSVWKNLKGYTTHII